jgi:GntR family transcriptional regulator
MTPDGPGSDYPGENAAMQGQAVSRPPIYEVIYKDLAAQISSGVFHPDDRLPSEADLAERYGVSRMTVRQAIGRLETEHLVVRRRGSGTYVAPPRSMYRRVNRLASFHEDLDVAEMAVTTRMHVQEVAVPGDEVRHRLKLKPRQNAIRLFRSRLLDQRVAAIQDSWLPYTVAPGLAREPLIGGSLYRTLRERYGIAPSRAEQEITATAATAEQAEWLGVTRGSPLIAITRVTYADGPDPLELAHSWTRPEFPLLIRLES